MKKDFGCKKSFDDYLLLNRQEIIDLSNKFMKYGTIYLCILIMKNEDK